MKDVQLSKRTGKLLAACCNATIFASDPACPHCERSIVTPAQERWPMAMDRAYSKAQLRELRRDQVSME